MSGRVTHRAPVALVVVALLGAAVFVVPLVAMVVKAPWSAVGEVFGSEPARDALVLSMVTSVVAASSIA